MAGTPDDTLRLELPDEGLDDGTWGGILNDMVRDIERAIADTHTETFNASNVTLDNTVGSANEARKSILIADGALSDNVNFVVPNKPKIYIVFNNTTEDFTVGIKTSGGSRLDIPQTETHLVWCDGADVFKTISAISTGSIALADNATNLGSVAAANYAQKAVLNQWTKPQIVDADQASLTVGPTPDTYQPDANEHTTIIIAQSEVTADDISILNPSNSPLDGQVMIFVIEQHAVTPVSVTWGSDFIFPDNTNVDLTQTVDKVDCFSFMYNSNLARWMNFGTALNLPRT